MASEGEVRLEQNVFRAIRKIAKALDLFQFSFGVGWLLFEDKLFRLGLFVLGSCPGESCVTERSLHLPVMEELTFKSSVLGQGSH